MNLVPLWRLLLPPLAWVLFGTASKTTGQPTTVTIPMQDSIILVADLYRPASDAPAPTVLMRTPYGREAWGTQVRAYSAAGYNVLLQDVRGRNGSGGDFLPFRHERADGLATLDWIIDQPWSDGRVVLLGASYSGFAALTLAAAGHPALEAVVNIGGWADPQALLLPGGTQHLMLNLAWTLHTLGRTEAKLDWDSIFGQVPLSHAVMEGATPHPAWRGTLPVYPAFDAELAATGMGKGSVEVPVLHLTGWNDFTYRGTLDAYRQIQALGAPGGRLRQRLIVGPWHHDQQKTAVTRVADEEYGPAAALGWDRMHALALNWYTQWLDPSSPGATPPDEPQAVLLDRQRPVHVFVMGSNKWVSLTAWPPPNTDVLRFYLTGAGGLETAPAAAAGMQTFLHDPSKPVPTVGGVNFHFFPDMLGPRDQSVLDGRHDVIRYLSPAFTNGVTLCGPVTATLFVSTDAQDADVAAKLVQVAPDGATRILEDGIIRLRFRAGLHAPAGFQPGEVVKVQIDLGDMAREIPAGHRLRLDISGSNFPKYDRNPGDGGSSMSATRFRTIRQNVHHGPGVASYLELTILNPGA